MQNLPSSQPKCKCTWCMHVFKLVTSISYLLRQFCFLPNTSVALFIQFLKFGMNNGLKTLFSKCFNSVLKPFFHHCSQNERLTHLHSNPPTPRDEPESGGKSQSPPQNCSELVIHSTLCHLSSSRLFFPSRWNKLTCKQSKCGSNLVQYYIARPPDSYSKQTLVNIVTFLTNRLEVRGKEVSDEPSLFIPAYIYKQLLQIWFFKGY